MKSRSTQLSTKLLYIVAAIAIVLNWYNSPDNGARHFTLAVAGLFVFVAIKGGWGNAFVNRLSELLAMVFLGVLAIKYFL
ncbi:hypothetical protein [Pseudoduganella sp.]|uniref:hypothetical protein n=1 Tax=Pseudoduganella sp. TaxID=1880898 RepID=UPI0035B214E3